VKSLGKGARLLWGNQGLLKGHEQLIVESVGAEVSCKHKTKTREEITGRKEGEALHVGVRWISSHAKKREARREREYTIEKEMGAPVFDSGPAASPQRHRSRRSFDGK